MRTFTSLMAVALASAPLFAGAASADDRLHLTPPLYQAQARATQQTRPSSDLITTPQIVPATIGGANWVASSRATYEAAAR